MANKNGEILEGLKELLWELLNRAKTDGRVRDFLDDFKVMLTENKHSAKEEFSEALLRLQEKHFPKFDKGESKND
ncbi:hypothetical protein ACTFSJ_04335 [Bacillus cereus group sp. MYBK12-2]|uniref:hypothetical protein n=1 Tax=Bacillus TaxID=1386 RepID=UPI0007723E74|nr:MULTISPECIES: hypothetical protein [Bacillus cereus group]KXI67251.1 hypothetical protein ACS51_20995 [Bacillus cereus]MCU5610685.1 hypothetical protein [Bacillus paranthracis]MDX5928265.1 hypothetical protein [Bacillus cereus group sp. BfR-BA-00967]HDR7285478.1 hypothetical protein [Bacillus paranthracis]